MNDPKRNKFKPLSLCKINKHSDRKNKFEE